MMKIEIFWHKKYHLTLDVGTFLLSKRVNEDQHGCLSAHILTSARQVILGGAEINILLVISAQNTSFSIFIWEFLKMTGIQSGRQYFKVFSFIAKWRQYHL